MDVAIQPASHRRPEESDDRQREEMNGAEPRKQRPSVHQSDCAQNREHNSENNSYTDRQLYEKPEQVKTEQKNQCASDRSKRGAVLAQKSADGAGGGAERDEDGGKSIDESGSRGEQT